MKKYFLLFALLLFSIPSFSQTRIYWQDSTNTWSYGFMNLGNFEQPTVISGQLYGRLPIALSQAQIDSLQKVVVSIIDTPSVKISGVTLTADSLTIKSPTAISNGTKLISSTAAALAGSASAKYVVITNNNASGTVYWGGTGVTTATGEPIYPMMSVQIPIANAATVYVIGAAVTVRYKILN